MIIHLQQLLRYKFRFFSLCVCMCLYSLFDSKKANPSEYVSFVCIVVFDDENETKLNISFQNMINSEIVEKKQPRFLFLILFYF